MCLREEVVKANSKDKKYEDKEGKYLHESIIT